MLLKKKIEKFLDDPTKFIIENNLNTLISITKYCAKKYYNNESIISDDLYDLLYETIKDIDPDNIFFKTIGAKVLLKLKVKLPYYMGSMDKIKSTNSNILNKWKNIYKGPYCVSHKLDGVSGLFIYNNNKYNLYTRGNGIEGTDISNLIKYIPNINNLNITDKNIAVRGELIISKNNFLKYKNNQANARNMVSGIVNSKTIKIDNMRDIDFIAYELINPWIIDQCEQWKTLETYGFDVVEHIDKINVDFTNLSTLLVQEKIKSIYEIDGLIISNILLPSNRTINNNPEYSFAFKDDSINQSAIVKVIKVKWAISKDGYIKPTLELEPTKLDGVTISSVTANNAKYIVDNMLGKDAEILLIRSGSVIPNILKIIKKADKPELPNINYKWTDTGVDIISVDESEERNIKELTFFFKKLGIKNIDKGIVRKLINSGIDNMYKIINIKLNDLENIEGFKDKLTNKIYYNIISKINDMSLLDLMTASNLFGHGIGRIKIKKILDEYPNILKIKKVDITNIEGFDKKTNDKFIIGLQKFNEFFNSLDKQMQKKLTISEEKKINNDNNEIFKDMIIVFSGFRNKEWEKIIESNGGKINNSISSKTTILVIPDKQSMNTFKVIKALELNINIMTKDKFENDYIK